MNDQTPFTPRYPKYHSLAGQDRESLNNDLKSVFMAEEAARAELQNAYIFLEKLTKKHLRRELSGFEFGYGICKFVTELGDAVKMCDKSHTLLHELYEATLPNP